MRLENFITKTTKNINEKVLELPQMSTEEKLLEIGAEKYDCGMVYENKDLGTTVYWIKLLDENFRETGLYVFYAQRDTINGTIH